MTEQEERERFPLGKPVNRKEPEKPTPSREPFKKGIFSIDGKLQTELPITGPRRAPPTTTNEEC